MMENGYLVRIPSGAQVNPHLQGHFIAVMNDG